MDKHTKIEITAGAFLWPAVLLMLLPIQWVFAMLFAGAFHEFCHMAAICLTGREIYRMHIGVRGATMETGALPPWQELLCALAGPLGSALLLLAAGWFPRLAICGAVHCLYNLLPLVPFDGGRILRSLLLLLLRNRGDKIWHCFQQGLRVCMIAACAILASKFGWMILLLSVALLKGTREEKLLANRPFWRYNRGTKAKGYQYDRFEAEDPPQRTEAGALHRWRIP